MKICLLFDQFAGIELVFLVYNSVNDALLPSACVSFLNVFLQRGREYLSISRRKGMCLVYLFVYFFDFVFRFSNWASAKLADFKNGGQTVTFSEMLDGRGIHSFLFLYIYSLSS